MDVYRAWSGEEEPGTEISLVSVSSVVCTNLHLTHDQMLTENAHFSGH